MVVTEELYYKWILPELLEKKSFKGWYETNDTLQFPVRNIDRIGKEGQEEVNNYIIELIKVYNAF